MTLANSSKTSDTPLSGRRVRTLAYVLSFLLLASILRLADWQVIRYNEIVSLLPRDSGDSTNQPRSTRGSIVDRNGMLLAMDVWGYQIYASPSGMGDESMRHSTSARPSPRGTSRGSGSSLPHYATTRRAQWPPKRSVS
jgi:cell division protein FtsI/penicillin-binding protein 2